MKRQSIKIRHDYKALHMAIDAWKYLLRNRASATSIKLTYLDSSKYHPFQNACFFVQSNLIYVILKLINNDVFSYRWFCYINIVVHTCTRFCVLFVSIVFCMLYWYDLGHNCWDFRYNLLTNNVFRRIGMPGPTPIPLLGEFYNMIRKVGYWYRYCVYYWSIIFTGFI